MKHVGTNKNTEFDPLDLPQYGKRLENANEAEKVPLEIDHLQNN